MASVDQLQSGVEVNYRPIIQSNQICVICGQRVQGRKRSDARVCVGECARILARRRTKAWKDKEPFSIRKGIMPDDQSQSDKTNGEAHDEEEG